MAAATALTLSLGLGTHALLAAAGLRSPPAAEFRRNITASLALPSLPSHPSLPAAAMTALCPHQAGARARDTVRFGARGQVSMPIKHVIILMQENRSFDHYFGRLSAAGQPEAEGFPASYVNSDSRGRAVRPFHLPTTCVTADPPHQWDNMHAHWNGGKMDGFVKEAAQVRRAGGPAAAQGNNHDNRDDDDDDDDDGDDETAGGRYALGYYDQRDIPFYYYLANTFSVADRYFSAVMAGTWPNRQFLYTGTAQKRSASTGMLVGKRTIFDSLDDARTSWAVYTDGPPRQDCVGWRRNAPGVKPTRDLLKALRTGSLPAVSFLDPAAEDEHPPADIQRGEAWARELFSAIVSSPAWPELAVFFTYDEGGGFFDHVPPPPACPPSADRADADYDRRGTRVPFVLISPWARRHHVSHETYDHASLLRFIQLMFDLPALTARDANADPLLDLFDFDSPPRLTVPPPPAAGRGGCRPRRLVAADQR